MRRLAEAHVADVLLDLKRCDLLPAIMFRTARNQCDVDVQQAGSSRDLRLSPPEQRELREYAREIMKRYEMEEQLITEHPHYQALITTAVGAHHAGQLLMWRLLLEELMAAGYLRMLVATGTVAAGVDFPARTVVITAHSKRGAEGFANLTAAELQQMSGRAGRRGKDTVGFCLVAPAPFCDARTVLQISKRAAEPLKSSYFPSPSSVLNLLRYRNVDDLRFTVKRSLASFVDKREADDIRLEAAAVEGELSLAEREFVREAVATEDEQILEGSILQGKTKNQKKVIKRIRRLRRQADELEARQAVLLEIAISGLQKLKYLDGLSLSEKGYWAATLCTSVVIELAEMIEDRLFDGASAERMSAIVASISGDEHRQYLESKDQALSRDDVATIQALLDRVSATRMPGIGEHRKVVLPAANTVLLWMHAESWQSFRGILALSGVAEGDAARLITQTAEQLNQITRLYASHPQLALRAEEAKRRLLRPPLTEVINLETA